MAYRSKSLHCALLVLHLAMMVIALSVLVISSLSLAELMDKRIFVEGVHESKGSDKDDVDALGPWSGTGDSETKGNSEEDRGVPQGTVTGPAMMLVAVAAATLLLSAFAFCSTLKMNLHLLSAFILLMAVVLAFELSSGIWALIARSRSTDAISVSLYKQLEDYEVGVKRTDASARRKGRPVTPWTQPWDVLQRQMECCGVQGPSDYFERGAIPLSCCAPVLSAAETGEEKPRGQGSSGPSPAVTTPRAPVFSCREFRQRGCLESLDGYVRERFTWLGFFAIAATFVEVIPLMLTVAYTIYARRELQRPYR